MKSETTYTCKHNGIKSGEAILLTPHPNGGWVIETGLNHNGLPPKQFGAYSNTEDMLNALAATLTD